MVQTFDLAWPGDQDERQVIADADIAHLHMVLGRGNFFCDHNTSSIRATSTGLFNSQKRRPLASTSTHRIFSPFSRKRSCSSPSLASSGPSPQWVYRASDWGRRPAEH